MELNNRTIPAAQFQSTTQPLYCLILINYYISQAFEKARDQIQTALDIYSKNTRSSKIESSQFKTCDTKILIDNGDNINQLNCDQYRENHLRQINNEINNQLKSIENREKDRKALLARRQSILEPIAINNIHRRSSMVNPHIIDKTTAITHSSIPLTVNEQDTLSKVISNQISNQSLPTKISHPNLSQVPVDLPSINEDLITSSSRPSSAKTNVNLIPPISPIESTINFTEPLTSVPSGNANENQYIAISNNDHNAIEKIKKPVSANSRNSLPSLNTTSITGSN